MPKRRPLHWLRFHRNLRNVARGGLRYLFGRQGQRLIGSMRLYFRVQLLFVLQTGGSLRSLSHDREVRLWIDGSESFRRLETLFARAHVSIVIRMFIWKDDETGRSVARQLIDAADRGVVVDITKEAVGDFFESSTDFLGTQNSDDPVWKAFWNHPRIRISHITNRDHAKVYIIDGHTLVLTGMNIADEYRYEWHDCMVELRGSAFVEQFLTRNTPPDLSSPIQLVINDETRKDIRPVFLKLLEEARERVVIEHAYFSDPEMVDHFILLSKRGIRLTIILPQRMELHNHANMQAIGRLLTEGDPSKVNVLIYPGYAHSKVVLVDHHIAFLGSANLYKGSLDEMGEVNVLIRGRMRAVWKLREMLRNDVFISRPVSSPPALLWLSKWLSWLGL